MTKIIFKKYIADSGQVFTFFRWSWQGLLNIIMFLVIIGQFAGLTYYLSQVVDTRAVIYALDNDAGNAIDVAQRSRWYNDNDFAGYGNLYFRLANTISQTLPHLDPSGTKTIHFALLLVSALSLFALSALMAYVLSGWNFRMLLLTPLFVWGFASADVWQTFLVRAHPDMLLCLNVALATYISFLSWQSPDNRYYFRLAGWLWGLAVATKMSVVMFLPFVLLTFFRAPTRAEFKRVCALVGHMLVVYFLIGFPQNFNVPRTLKFLAAQSTYSFPATAESVAEWFSIYKEQLFLPLLLVLAASFGRKNFSRMDSRLLWRSALLFVGPFALLLMQRIIASHQHYPMPMIASQVVLLGALGALIVETPRLTERMTLIRNVVYLVMLVAFFGLMGSLPKGFDERVAERLECRPEARAAASIINNHLAAKKLVFATPYVPTATKAEGLRSSWHPTKEYIVEGKFDVIALKQKHTSRFSAPESEAYLRNGAKNYEATRDLYALFVANEFSDPVIGEWKMTYSDACTWQIWEKAKP